MNEYRIKFTVWDKGFQTTVKADDFNDAKKRLYDKIIYYTRIVSFDDVEDAGIPPPKINDPSVEFIKNMLGIK